MTDTPSSSPTEHPHRYTAALAGLIEREWQERWETFGTFRVPNPGEQGFDGTRPKKYILDMFPYPSGVGLHVGHPLGYIATDICARYLRMTGHNVLHAMGFDAFGLPAEQYAVQTNQHPRTTTYNNIATMKSQLRRLGLGHDPRRGVATTDPAFYKWTQWIFLQIYNSWYDASVGKARPISELRAALQTGSIGTRSGRAWDELTDAERREEVDSRRLAYLAEVPVNWCPMLGTVLANEEVTAEGRSERGNFPVYKRPLKQWMMRITAYSDRLAADLSTLDWPEPIKLLQRNWIGRSEGADVEFSVHPPPGTRSGALTITVFTTRPDTLFGATYMVLSPEHPLVDSLIGSEPPAGFRAGVFPGYQDRMTPAEAVATYRAYAKSRTDDQRREAKDKTGCFTGSYAVNPVNGHRIPVFIADYVLMGYGTGAIMAVPGHDDRDHEFAAAFDLPVEKVVQPSGGEAPDGCFAEEGIACNSPPVGESPYTINGLATPEAKRHIIAALESAGAGRARTTYKLRDWLFSRQRYWGEPFPIVFDEAGVAHDLPESMLPVLLPELKDFRPESSEDPAAPVRTPLARASDWVNIELDLGDGPRRFTRETNTMPNWAGSCWYYLRYLDPENDSALCGTDAERYWMAGRAPGATTGDGRGVDLYVGGVEHAVLHLLYARFWHKVLYDLGHVSTIEPFQRLFNQGYIQGYAFTDARGAYVEASEVLLPDGTRAVENQDHPGPYSYNGRPVTREYGKMGKSLKNAVSPDEIASSYGCDTLRLYEMSMGPLEASKPWNTRDITGSFRFLQRVWRNLIDEQTGASRVSDIASSRETSRVLHKTILGVRRDMESLGYNTVVSKLIEFNNHLGSLPSVPLEAARALILMLAPLAPHISEELFRRVIGGSSSSLAFEPYPIGDPALAADDEIEIPVSIAGRPKHRIRVSPGLDAAALEAAAMADPKVRELIEGKTLKKVIVVPGKMVNLVLA